MIFFITASLIFFISIYLLFLPWDRKWARITFALNIIPIIALLILFGLDFKIKLKQPKSMRRTILGLVDISASTGLDFSKVTKQLTKKWPEYDVEIIPFSNEIQGAPQTEATGLFNSCQELYKYLSDRYLPEKIAGLVLITDGNETEKIFDLKKDFSFQEFSPSHIIYLSSGSQKISFDKSVSFKKVPRFFPRYKKETITFAVSVISAKIDGVPVELRLDGKNIGTVFVPLKNGYGEGSFDLIIKNEGLFLLEAKVALDTRETIKKNNSDYLTIEGVIKGFRVLHISGHPSVDTSFIRRGLQNIPGVDVISFFILREQSNRTMAPNSELSLIPFPTDQLFRSELDNFDLIIINDFTLKKFLQPIYINNIAKFVKAGGGLLWLGGKQSFLLKDFLGNNLHEILPVEPSASSNWQEKEYHPLPEDLSFLISFNDLARPETLKNLKLKGINVVEKKPWANQFWSTSDHEPLVVGGFVGKGKVMTILTNSFWRFSYEAGLKNEFLLKALSRYVLGISSRPVEIYHDYLSFQKDLLNKNFENVLAKINFKNFDGTSQKIETINLKQKYSFKERDSQLMEVSLENQGTVVDKYSLVNYNQKSWDEHTYVPLGKKFLANIAEKGGGQFLLANKENWEKSLEELKFQEAVLVTEAGSHPEPLFKHKGLILILLYLGLISFYLKSKYLNR